VLRFLSFVFLVLFAGAVVLFAIQNNDAVTVQFWQWSVTLTLAQLVGIVYALGMLTGWSVVGLFRRSLRRASEVPPYRGQPART
jgi:putative membrane protein